VAAPGAAALFERWTNIRRDLHVACGKAGIARARRTICAGHWRRSCALGLVLGHPSCLALGCGRRTRSGNQKSATKNSGEMHESSRIENPRVGDSIPSLGTEKQAVW
jgi:hypothetical protein